MSLMNLLAALTGQIDNKTAQAVGPDGLPVDPNAVNEVEPLVVTAPKKEPEAPPKPSVEQGASRVPFNYNNADAAKAVDQAMLANGAPRGGSANPGLYGLLPERMQHGTLRNVLGAIGDAFLVQSGNAPTYGPRMERQQIGQAMAGYNPDDPASVQAAIQRVAATGAPDSIDMVEKLQKGFTDSELRKATMDQTATYRESVADARADAELTRRLPYIGAMIANAKTPEQYAAAYDRAERLAQQINPRFSAADLGLVDPADWTPEATAGVGLKRNDIVVSQDKAEQRATSRRNTDVNAGARITAAGISGDKATNAVILEGLIEKQNRGQPLTPAEQDTFDHMTGKKKKRALPANLMTAPKVPPKAAPKKDGIPTLTPAQAAKLPKGAKFRTTDGRIMTRQ